MPRRYYILELSADLRDRQQALLKTRLPNIQDRIVWLESLPEPGFRGVIVANELLDALPVHCFTITESGAAELYVERRDEQWSWCQAEPSSAELAKRIEDLRRAENLPVGYISEINLAAEAWVGSMADILAAGMLLLIDYGFPRREYYHPERNRGTLMCHYRHRAHGERRRRRDLPDRGRLDGGERRRVVVGALGAHRGHHRRRSRDPDAAVTTTVRTTPWTWGLESRRLSR